MVGLSGSAPPFRLGLTFIAGEPLLWGEEGSVEFIGGEDATTLVVDAGLTGCHAHGQRACALRHVLVRWRAWAWTPPLGLAWGGRTVRWATKVVCKFCAKGAKTCCASAAQAQAVRHSSLKALTSCSRCLRSCLSTVRCA